MNQPQTNLADRVEWTAIRNYLASRGWVSSKSNRDDVAIFRKDRAEVVLPVDRDLADYAEGVAVVAARVAEHEGRSTDSVIADLLHPQVDTLRAGRTDEGSEDGTLGFEESSHFIAGIRRAILAAACSEERPTLRFHAKMNLKKSQELVDRCRLGQTQRGSFVLSVLCPFALESSSSEHFGRRTLTRLLSSAGKTVRMLRSRGIDAVVAESEQALPIISANLCDAIVEMAPGNGRGDLWLDASWAPLLAAPTSEIARVRIDRDMFTAFQELAERMRPLVQPRHDHFVGRVVELSGEDNEEGQLEGDVQFSFLIGEDLVRARATLTAPDYGIALNAHQAQQFVSVRGILHGQGKRATLIDVADLRVVP